MLRFFSNQGVEIPCNITRLQGQDAQFATGCSMEGRFFDNDNGTVTDVCTGLMWQKTPGGPEALVDWFTALRQCEQLELAGHDDWRLPNIRELESIVDYSRSGPAVAPVFEMPFVTWFWSSTSRVSFAPGSFESEKSAKYVYFADGLQSSDLKVYPKLVLAVRNASSGELAEAGTVPGHRASQGTCVSQNGDANADGGVDMSDAVTILNFLCVGISTALVPLCPGPPIPTSLPDTGQVECFGTDANPATEVPCSEAMHRGQDGHYATGCPREGRFTDHGDDTVTDHCTNLMWSKPLGEEGYVDLNWQGALDYCQDLELGGFEDWRLPNARELSSIVEYGCKSCDSPLRVVGTGYWSSTTLVTDPSKAWGGGHKADKRTVIAVRAIR